jgi:hypothetical protein
MYGYFSAQSLTPKMLHANAANADAINMNRDDYKENAQGLRVFPCTRARPLNVGPQRPGHTSIQKFQIKNKNGCNVITSAMPAFAPNHF